MPATAPELVDYQRIADIYQQELASLTDPHGSRLQLPFSQAVRLLAFPSPFNASLPEPFTHVARRIQANDSATEEHFRYDENRQFFLSDLFDYIKLRARGCRME